MSDPDLTPLIHASDAEWFAASGHCGGCGLYVAVEGVRYEADDWVSFCGCENCGCGPHPAPLFHINGQPVLNFGEAG